MSSTIPSNQTFSKGGRTWITRPTTDGNRIGVYYQINTGDPNKDREQLLNVLNRYGANYGGTEGEGENTKYYVLVSGFENVSTETSSPIWIYRALPPGKEVANGNAAQVDAIARDAALRQQITSSSPTNAATTNPEPAPPPAAAPPTTGTGANATTDPLYPKRRGAQAGNNVLIYPLNMHESQDYIRFEVMETTRTANVDKKTIPTLLKDYGEPEKFLQVSPKEPKIILPIQAPIVDQNLTNWGSGELNEIQRMFAEESAKTMVNSEQGGIAGAFLKQISSIYGNIAANDKQYSNILYSYLLGQAVNAPGLSAKLFGGILNPNMELLFQGPLLRPFTFTFKMSPREKGEADNVKQIIKTFKKNMAPRADGIFLQSPNLFKIQYYNGNKEHQSINRIKTCSLQNCSVDYTPNQTYMTYDDEEATMVSYTMTLTFSEIVPIYQSDYDSHPIGY